MVIDVLSSPGSGGLSYALAMLESSLKRAASASDSGTVRPWAWIEVTSKPYALYLPALSQPLRQAAAGGRLLWFQLSDTLAASVSLALLQSTLCEGVVLMGLDSFEAKATNSQVWSRRWQLAAHKSCTDFVWLHELNHFVVGFDLRLQWNRDGVMEIRKGRAHFEKLEELKRGGPKDKPYERQPAQERRPGADITAA